MKKKTEKKKRIKLRRMKRQKLIKCLIKFNAFMQIQLDPDYGNLFGILELRLFGDLNLNVLEI